MRLQRPPAWPRQWRLVLPGLLLCLLLGLKLAEAAMADLRGPAARPPAAWAVRRLPDGRYQAEVLGRKAEAALSLAVLRLDLGEGYIRAGLPGGRLRELPVRLTLAGAGWTEATRAGLSRAELRWPVWPAPQPPVGKKTGGQAPASEAPAGEAPAGEKEEPATSRFRERSIFPCPSGSAGQWPC